MEMDEKKKKELDILERFIIIYTEQIEPGTDFKIFDIDEAEIKFPGYKGESPDWMILYNGKIMGVELFDLMQDQMNKANLWDDEKEKDIHSVAHLYNIREEKNKKYLDQMEELAPVALEQILKKYKKMDKYIKYPIWLLGYAANEYNMRLISPLFDDKIDGIVAEYIVKKLPEDFRVEKVWLVECKWGKERVLKIK